MRRRIKKNTASPKKKDTGRAAPRRSSGRALKSARKYSLKKSTRKINPRLTSPVFEPPAGATGPASAAPDDRIPTHYGEDRLALLTRDPWWLFAYWEVTPARQSEVAREIERANGRPSSCRTVLRVYDVTGGLAPSRSNSFFDIELNFQTDNWYVDVGKPDREWMAEIGFRDDKGRFFVLVRSNRVRTPAFGISEVLDEEWMLPEEVYFRLIGRSLGAGASGNSMDIRRLLEKYLKNVVSSENSSQISRKAL